MSKQGKKLREKIEDYLAVFRAIWFILLFLFVGFAAFFFAPQGQDMLFALIDTPAFLWGKILLTIAGLSLWAVQTAFGSRLLIMVSDISFHNKTATAHATDVRVHHRQRLASSIPRGLFFAPYFITFVSFTKTAFSYDLEPRDRLYLLIVLVLLIVVSFGFYRLTYNLYCRRQQKMKTRKHDKVVKELHYLNKIEKLDDLGEIKWYFRIGVGLAILLILLYSFLGAGMYVFLGSIHLITMSLGCWTAIVYLIDYSSKMVWPFTKTSLLLLVIIMSFINHDHPVAIEKDSHFTAPNKPILKYWSNWCLQNKR